VKFKKKIQKHEGKGTEKGPIGKTTHLKKDARKRGRAGECREGNCNEHCEKIPKWNSGGEIEIVFLKSQKVWAVGLHPFSKRHESQEGEGNWVGGEGRHKGKRVVKVAKISKKKGKEKKKEEFCLRQAVEPKKTKKEAGEKRGRGGGLNKGV